MQRHFDEQIQELLRKLVLMARLADSMIGLALRMLLERNEKYCEEVKSKEEELDRLMVEVDEWAIKLTALQQPVGSDVRFLFMASRIGSELERIGDKAVTMCKNSRELIKAPLLKPLVDLPIMAEVVQKMLGNAIESLVKRDLALADLVLNEEEKVNAFRERIFRELLTYMMTDANAIPRALALILISRNLKRVGDHATNIAEEVIYLVKGRDVRHQKDAPAGGA
ncbi:MAG: phosphate signaling complex protein PhoU [Planctomycetota bacterium]